MFWIGSTEACEIIVTDAEKSELFSPRTGLAHTTYRWPNNTVVYNMNSPPFKDSEKELVERSLKLIEEVTCVKFVTRTIEDYFINLTVRLAFLIKNQIFHNFLMRTLIQRPIVAARLKWATNNDIKMVRNDWIWVKVAFTPAQ